MVGTDEYSHRSSLYHDGKQALGISRLSNHLFHALRVVVLTLVGSDVDTSIGGSKAILLGPSDWAKGFGPAVSKDTSQTFNLPETQTLPLASQNLDLSFLQEQFADSMRLLEEFSAANCRTVRRALILIKGVLNLHGSLSATLSWNVTRPRSTNREASNGQDTSRSAFAADWSLARSGMRSGHSNTINQGAELYSQEQSPQTAIDAMLWQAPEIDFLSPNDIDQIIASFTNIA